jgi:hypothetical protein
MTVPYAFSAATSAIPLSQLDANFNTTITLGNTAIQLGNTVTTLNNMTLANVTISSGNVTLTNVTVTTANVTTANITTAIIGTANVTTANVATSIVTTSETLSYGTANGVGYLNGSKVLTTGSALTFDGAGLGVGGAITNRVSATVNTSDTDGIRVTNSQSGSLATLAVAGTNGNGISGWPNASILESVGTGGLVSSAYNGPMIFQVNGRSEGMRLTSTGLGIGTSSPGTKLDVVGAGTFRVDGSGSTTPLILRNNNTASTQLVKLGFDSNGAIKASINAAVYGNDYMTFNVGSDTERMRLDSSGNLGLGVTPSAWSGKAIDVSGYASFATWNNASGVVNNGFYNSSGQWIYKNTAAASAYYQVSGQHVWQNAPSGTAGNAISFTQAMTLDASGNLLVGATSGSGARIYAIQNGTNDIFQAEVGTSGTTLRVVGTGSSVGVGYFTTSSGLAGQINCSGTSTTYSTSSDYRLKENIAPMTGALAKVAALKPVTYKWKADGSDGEGFIAHELAEVCPSAVVGAKDAVDAEGKPQYQGIDTSFLVATLTAAIKEQQALIESLTARVTQLEGK